MANTVTVGIADLNVVKSPDTLVTYALGSCVGICLYDPDKKDRGAGSHYAAVKHGGCTGS